MNTILLKVQKYLDSISKQPAELDNKLVEEFGEACKNALLKQFEEERSCLLYTSPSPRDS